MTSIRFSVCILFALLVPIGIGEPTEASGLRHNLDVTLVPEENRLYGVDSIEASIGGRTELSFFLSRRASVSKLIVGGRPSKFRFENGVLRLKLDPKMDLKAVRIIVHYEAVFNDPVPTHPINTDNPGYGVTGTISSKGCFLLAGAGWYPESEIGKASYHVNITAPSGMIALTAGRPLGHLTEGGKTVSRWEISQPVEGLSLSAGPYRIKERYLDRIRIATYFFPESISLADRYLEASEKFIRRYEKLFGPYPFEQFAIVENFFQTGYGFPSYTLLGSRVLRLPFIPDTSLGHEIAHCWWGNGVLIDDESGNWSEALATYVADYLNMELLGAAEARDYRLQMLRNYTALASTEAEFPLAGFRSRFDPESKVIGYDKGAMVFHMLRKRLGDESFWTALREIYRTRCFEKVSWKDFQSVFERIYGQPLGLFFDQWIFRKGAPELALKGVSRIRSDRGYRVTGIVEQEDPTYDLRQVDITVETASSTHRKRLNVSGSSTVFEWSMEEMPVRIRLDPDSHLLRKLHPSEMPASINSLKGSQDLLVILADGLPIEVRDSAHLLIRSLGLKQGTTVSETKLESTKIEGRDLLIIGSPRREPLLNRLPDLVRLEIDRFTVDGRLYDRSGDAFFGVFEHPTDKDRAAAVFFPLSVAAVNPAAEKITHYGKYSYLVFREGGNREKGIWPIDRTPMEVRWK